MILSPFPILETERLLLRSATLNDAQRFYELRTDKKVMEFVDRAPFASLDESITFLNDKILIPQQRSEVVFWVIELKTEPGRLIGTAGIFNIQKEHYRAELGYTLDWKYWKNGIMKEAVGAIINWVFNNTDLHSIEANVNPENKGSAALLRSLQFEQEAHFKENYFYNGVFKDSLIFSLINAKK